MSEKAAISISVIALVGLLTSLFVGLKYTDQIDWSWQWVLSPIWISTTFAISLLSMFGLMMLVPEDSK